MKIEDVPSLGMMLYEEITVLENELNKYGTMGEAAKRRPRQMRKLLAKLAVVHGPESIEDDLDLLKLVNITNTRRTAQRELRSVIRRRRNLLTR